MTDSNDPLAHCRGRFFLPEGVIYLDGNSLGPMAKNVPGVMKTAIEDEWATGLITSWNKADWWGLPLRLGDRIARLIGGDEGTCVVTDTTSINIFKALNLACNLRPDRNIVIAEQDSFPTDLYIAQGLADINRHIELRLIGVGGATLDDLLDDKVAAVLLSHVDYRTGALLDMAGLTQKIHQAGAVAIWDLCHTAGVFPVDLQGANVDLAVGCTYKYLNGGPGAPAFIYANKRHHQNLVQPLTGWWGHAEPFAFKPDFAAAPGIRALLCGTQPILSMRALEAALDVFDDVDMRAVREQSKALTTLFADLVMASCADYGVKLLSPQNAAARGSQIALAHENGFQIMQALIARGVIGDFRQPNIMRFGFSPLYLQPEDVRIAAKILTDILATREWEQEIYSQRNAVT